MGGIKLSLARRAIAALVIAMTGAAAQATCAPVPSPVVTLDIPSPYRDDSASRSAIHAQNATIMRNALRPVDEYVRLLSRYANQITRQAEDLEADLETAGKARNRLKAEVRCAERALKTWANARALRNLDSTVAELTVGGRLAGIALAYEQIRPYMRSARTVAAVDAWLKARNWEQVLYWDTDAPPNARTGNLRAWSALAQIATGQITNDPALTETGINATRTILCTAGEDGHLPGEMRRERLALHYQLHATSPLVVSVARTNDAPDGLTIDTCNGALQRIVAFTLADLAGEGLRSELHSGAAQSYFTDDTFARPHMLAWIPAYRSLEPLPVPEVLQELLSPGSNSKLGGDQTLLWPENP